MVPPPLPQDLIRAGVYGKAEDFRESLKTSNPKEAETLAHLRAIELLTEWDEKRRELGLSTSGNVERRSKPGDEFRPLSSLSEQQRRLFLHHVFLGLEKQAYTRLTETSSKMLRVYFRSILPDTLNPNYTKYVFC